jgi:hypothetical protein
MRRTILVVEVVVAVIFEDGLRHDRIAFAEWRRSDEDFASSVGNNVRLSVLNASS